MAFEMNSIEQKEKVASDFFYFLPLKQTSHSSIMCFTILLSNIRLENGPREKFFI